MMDSHLDAPVAAQRLTKAGATTCKSTSGLRQPSLWMLWTSQAHCKPWTSKVQMPGLLDWCAKPRASAASMKHLHSSAVSTPWTCEDIRRLLQTLLGVRFMLQKWLCTSGLHNAA